MIIITHATIQEMWVIICILLTFFLFKELSRSLDTNLYLFFTLACQHYLKVHFFIFKISFTQLYVKYGTTYY